MKKLVALILAINVVCLYGVNTPQTCSPHQRKKDNSNAESFQLEKYSKTLAAKCRSIRNLSLDELADLICSIKLQIDLLVESRTQILKAMPLNLHALAHIDQEIEAYAEQLTLIRHCHKKRI